MTSKDLDLFEDQKTLVLARLRTLNQDAKVMFGADKQITVREMIQHIERGDRFGKDAIKVQIEMLKVLAGSA